MQSQFSLWGHALKRGCEYLFWSCPTCGFLGLHGYDFQHRQSSYFRKYNSLTLVHIPILQEPPEGVLSSLTLRNPVGHKCRRGVSHGLQNVTELHPTIQALPLTVVDIQPAKFFLLPHHVATVLPRERSLQTDKAACEHR